VKRYRIAAAALAAALLGATPPPVPFAAPKLPDKPLHVQLQVEVNNRGQVVRVDHGTLSGDQAFDIMTLGNAMQMWIRKPDGSAIVGLYRVAYDYDPRTHKVQRSESLISTGGKWAKRPGAATQIIAAARRETKAVYARLRAEQQKRTRQSERNLPDINAAVKRAMSSPTPKP
jgi:hypothetical protein